MSLQPRLARIAASLMVALPIFGCTVGGVFHQHIGLSLISTRAIGVDQVPSPDGDWFKSFTYPPKRALEVAVSSTTNLFKATELWNDLAVSVSICNDWQNRNNYHEPSTMFAVSGVYWHNALLIDIQHGDIAANLTWHTEQQHRYRVYVAANLPNSSKFYDIAPEGRDICMQFTSISMLGDRNWTDTVVIPARDITQAFEAE